jgi:hypothetical protein
MLPQVLTAVLAGLMAGCRNLPEVEQVTELMSTTVRRLLKLPRRLADTTMRDVICRLKLDELRAVLHRAVKAAARRGGPRGGRAAVWGGGARREIDGAAVLG